MNLHGLPRLPNFKDLQALHEDKSGAKFEEALASCVFKSCEVIEKLLDRSKDSWKKTEKEEEAKARLASKIKMLEILTDG